LATALMERFSDWILSGQDDRQILITSHNPAVLDGLPLQDDRVRLFTVDRDNAGKTIVRRVDLTTRLRKMAAKGASENKCINFEGANCSSNRRERHPS